MSDAGARSGSGNQPVPATWRSARAARVTASTPETLPFNQSKLATANAALNRCRETGNQPNKGVMGHVAPLDGSDEPSGAQRNSLVGHWLCNSSTTPTGLFLTLSMDFRPNGNFRFMDSQYVDPRVRVWEGTWDTSGRMIALNYRTWQIGSEGTAYSSQGRLSYGFVDQRKSAFEIIVPWYQGGEVAFICGSSLEDIVSRNLLDVLERDLASHKINGRLTTAAPIF